MASKPSRVENQILHFSDQKKWDKVEALWPQIVEDPPSDPKFYATVLRRLLKAGKAEDLRSWTLLAIEAVADDPRRLIQICRGVLLVYPEFEELRQPLIGALRSFYSDHGNLDEYFEEAGLNHEAGLNQPLNRFFQFISCAPGEVYSHKDWGQGRVVRLDTRQDKVVVEFPGHGERTFSFDGVRDFLEKVAKSHLFAQRILNPQGLVKRAEEGPVEFMKYCLKCLGGSATRAELKEQLTAGAFSEKQWSSWWSRNRDAFRMDPYIGFSSSPANPELVLRDEPEPLHEEMLRNFRRVETFSARYNLIQDMFKMGRSYPVPDETMAQVQDLLEKALGGLNASQAAERIEYLCLIEEMRRARGQEPDDSHIHEAVRMVRSAEQPVEFLSKISVADYQLQLAGWLRDADTASWHELAEELFLSGPARLGQWVLRDAMERGDSQVAEHMAEQLLHRPYENTDLFLWLVRALRDKKLPGLNVEVESALLVNSVLDLLSDCQQRIDHADVDTSGLRGLKVRLEGLLSENHHSLVTDVFETYETEDARRRHRELMDCHYLTDSFKVSLDHALRAVRHDIEDLGSAAAQEHMVTAESLERKTREYQNLKNVEIPANSKAIGTAAAMGDLSENAEYESAKERQKVLFRRLEALEDQLQRARPVGADSIRTDVIGFGTTFEIKNMDNGGIEEYSMLGLWDAEPDKHILSYETPFGKQFLNRKAGDILIVSHPGGGSTQYKVLAIRNALKKGEG